MRSGRQRRERRGAPRRVPARRTGGAAATALALWLLVVPASAARVDPDCAAPGPGTTSGALVASASLIENASAWDGCRISFAGEVVGEAMRRGDHGWLYVNDDAGQRRSRGADRRLVGYNSGLAVWAPLELARRVRLFGSYRNEGDAVRVLGEFHAACREHGGDMDIHATELEVVDEGRAIARRPNTRRLGIGLGLLACAGALALIRRRTRRLGDRPENATLPQ